MLSTRPGLGTTGKRREEQHGLGIERRGAPGVALINQFTSKTSLPHLLNQNIPRHRRRKLLLQKLDKRLDVRIPPPTFRPERGDIEFVAQHELRKHRH